MMKKIISLLAVSAFFAFCLYGSEPELFTLDNGIPVYVKHNDQSQLTAVYGVIKGGVQYLTAETSGLEDAVLSLMATGSRKYSYEDLKKFGYETNGGFENYSINDGSVYGMSCITKYFDETFDRYEDCFFEPSFEKKQYDLLMQDYNQNVTSTMNDPSGMLGYYIQQMIYAGHPYSARTSVTVDSIENITLAAIQSHYRTLLDKRRIAFVASGNLDTEKLIEFLNRRFGKLKALSGPLPEENIPGISIEGEPVVLFHQSAAGGAQIMRAFKTPDVRDEDYPVARIVEDIYSDVLYNIVREKYGICYTPSSVISSSDAAFGVEALYRTSNIKDARGAVEEARKMMAEGTVVCGKDRNGNILTEALEGRLEGYKNKYVNGKYISQATVGGVCSRMAASLLQFGDIGSADEITVKAKKCSAEDVLRVFRKYWVEEPGQWFAVVGPEDCETAEAALRQQP